jgi:ribosome-associated translation inhibitor RaiA
VLDIELRSSNLPISTALREHVARRIDFALRRFAIRIERIVVRLVDVNGPKGGLDKRCRIVARLSRSRSVVVEAIDADAYVAVSQAAIRLDERVARLVTRRRPRPLATRRPTARRARALALAIGRHADAEPGPNEEKARAR